MSGSDEKELVAWRDETRCRVQNCPRLAVFGTTACYKHMEPSERLLASRRAAADLACGGNFRGAFFRGLDLSGVTIGKADLTDANVLGVDISRSDFSNALLERTLLFRSARAHTRFPAYFNTHCLDKFERLCIYLEDAVDLCIQADERKHAAFYPAIGRELEFREISRLAQAAGFQVDGKLEVQGAMNVLYDRYIATNHAYFVRQYPGKIVEDISWELMRWICEHPRDLYKLHPTTVERIVAEVFKSEGYECEVTTQTRDGGFDLVLLHQSSPIDTKILVEVKRYDPSSPVGVAIVRQLVGAMVKEGTKRGFIVTTSRFTKPARRFAMELASLPTAGSSRYELELIDYQRLRELVLGYTEIAADAHRL